MPYVRTPVPAGWVGGLVSFARAFLADPALLVLDEATSSPDELIAAGGYFAGRHADWQASLR